MLGYWNCNNIFVWYCSLLQLENPSIHWWVAIASSHPMAAVVGNLKCIFFGQSQEFWLSANQFLQKTIFSFTSSKSENYSMHCRRVKGFVVRGASARRGKQRKFESWQELWNIAATTSWPASLWCWWWLGIGKRKRNTTQKKTGL